MVKYYLMKNWHLDDADLEEVVQETMLAALQSCQNYRGLNNAKPGTFLLGIANHVAQTHFRKKGIQRRRNAPLELAESIGVIFRDEAEASDLARRLRDKISRLKDNYVQVLKLVFYKGLKEGEVAEIMGLPADKVYSLKSDALKRLRKLCLKDPAMQSLFYS
ncbi:MAG: sigma-70 family RNA polymerase sigma factor [candidate division KSB1 bacterium]|nr:sigma-70 family RNA polymerase sigma factor [candidate division KSB1 bacterium]MDZ7275225.1 sigma-70 family RNA polymerase sigma factor [candidate division KSB1 bacterium]MDZ7287393.1 sigma-70 family RNA polymerase sigma factor [candidate division KSB1 bacterium]MDZ7299507.1 sigma-70 family RNA polymerase sigma factor [candidate division KSB1 bacterium]MDZ7305447.1 sigma-70 family RNA polymerase sigma factor [candidate division KSB1 bacterium]